jgi:Zn-finger nucleic acid-binding protein
MGCKIRPVKLCAGIFVFRRAMSTVHFFCAICGSALTSDARLERPWAECPKCEHVIPVPIAASSSGPLEVFPRGVLALDVSFLCPACDCKLQIDARWEGRSVNCPKCDEATTVPWWSRRAATPVRLSADEVDFLTGSVEPGPNGHS